MKIASALLKCRVQNRELSIANFRKDIWTSDRVVKSPCKDIVIPKINLYDYIWEKLDKWPTKIATVCGITNRQYKYEELYKLTRRFGANLRKKFKMQDGDAVAVMMKNSPEYPIILLGILTGGGVATTLNPIYTSYEVQRLLQLSEAKMVIADEETVPIIKGALKLSNINLPIITVNMNQALPEGTVSYKELVEDDHVDLSVLKEVKRTHDDVSIMPYSSGTTGLPKCVELTNMNFVANCEQQNSVTHYNETTETHQDVLAAVLPFFHSYGLSVLMLHKLSAGLKIVTLPKFQPNTFLNALVKYKVNLLYSAPPTILFLSGHPQVTFEHLQYLRLTVCGAAPLPPADIQNFINKSQGVTEFGQIYGMTEASPLLIAFPLGYNRHYEAVGFALPNVELRVVDGEMNNLGPGEVGELVMRGPNIMKGYKNNPEANREVFLEGRWCRTGDLAKMGENGMVTISDRLKDLIKVNAYQVPPAELEYVLKEHPDIFDAAVIGVPDPKTGEKPKAFIVLKDGAKTTDKQIMEFVNERVAKYKRIQEVSFVENIPKNPSGKTLRKELKEKYC